nr:hypothetical protein Iba_scaffold60026CG0010 [Ipomoea batatas]
MVYFILQLNGTIEPRTLLSKGVMSLLTWSPINCGQIFLPHNFIFKWLFLLKDLFT